MQIIHGTQILRYMYETTLTDDQRHLVASYVIQQGLQSRDEKLCDEIYVQLCNQTMGDHSRLDLRIDRAWQLMAGCLSAFPPSAQFIKYLLK